VAFKGKTRIDFMPFKGRRRINSPCVRKVLKFILFFFKLHLGVVVLWLVLFITNCVYWPDLRHRRQRLTSDTNIGHRWSGCDVGPRKWVQEIIMSYHPNVRMT